jgi:hypothetical protein
VERMEMTGLVGAGKASVDHRMYMAPGWCDNAPCTYASRHDKDSRDSTIVHVVVDRNAKPKDEPSTMTTDYSGG